MDKDKGLKIKKAKGVFPIYEHIWINGKEVLLMNSGNIKIGKQTFNKYEQSILADIIRDWQ